MTGKKKHSSSVFRIVKGFGAALLLVLVLKPIVPCLWSREPGICPILEIPSLARREIKEAADAGKLKSRVSVSESASSVSETVKSDAGKQEEPQVADAAATAENGRELAAAKLALSAELDFPNNGDNLSSQTRSSRVEEEEEEESLTSGVESMSEDDKEREVKSLWRCQGGSGAADCSEPQALLLAEGALAERVHAVCAAYALTALTSAPTLAVWPADRHLPATTFRHLFRPASSVAIPPGDVADRAVSGEARDVWVRDVRMASSEVTARLHTSQQVMLKECPRGSRRKSRRTALPFRRYLAPSAQSQVCHLDLPPSPYTLVCHLDLFLCLHPPVAHLSPSSRSLIPFTHPIHSSQSLIPFTHPNSSSHSLIPIPHPIPSSHSLIPIPHPIHSSQFLIPFPHPTPSSHSLIPIPHPIPSSHSLIPFTHPIHSSHSLIPFPHPNPSSHSLIPIPHPIPSSQSLIPFPHPIPSSHSLIPIPHPIPSSHSLIPFTHPIHSSHSLIPFPHPNPSSQSLIPFPHPNPSSQSLIPFPHPNPSSQSLIPFPHPNPSSQSLIPFTHPIHSSHSLITFPHPIPSSHSLIPIPHPIPSSQSLIPFPHPNPSSHSLIPFTHPIPSSHSLIPIPHPIPSSQSLIPFPHPNPSSHSLIPIPHPNPSSHFLIPIPHPNPSSHSLIPIPHPNPSSHSLIPIPHPNPSSHSLIPFTHPIPSSHSLIPFTHPIHSSLTRLASTSLTAYLPLPQQASGAVNLDGCAYDKHVDACLGRLRPSTAVGALVMHEDLAALKLSKAIYAVPVWPTHQPPSVPCATSPCSSCTTPMWGSPLFPPLTFPLPPPHHHQTPPAGTVCSGCPRVANSSAPLCAMRRVTMAFLHDPHVAFALAARAAPDVTAVGDFFSELRRPLVLKASQSRLDTCQEGGRRELAEGKGVLGSEVGGSSIKCAQLQAAELFALSLARALVPIHRWAIEARFILAQGSHRSPAFQVLPSICETERLPPIIRHRWSWFTQVEEKLKLVVCTMPKVAANSWLMWLRAKLGQPDPNDPILALDVDKAGWHLLGRHFTEKEAVRLVTRPDFFRFTFVRNPFSRALSAYSNKLVVTDTPNNKTGPGSREYWNERFFRFVRPQFELLKGEDDLVSFPDFMRLVALMKNNFRWKMDRHVAPQVDVCFMQMIKYDFVGRFENLEEDAKYVVNRFGGDHLDIFNFGVNAHQTRADTKLVKKYTK
ncbi:unnamed protein product, partial [Closterium sp. Naga37s-1]